MCREKSKQVGTVAIRDCEKGSVVDVQAILDASAGAALWSEEAITRALESSPEYHLVGIRGRKISSFISGRRVADEGEILNLAVKPQYRRQGEGRMLVTALLDRFGRDGAVQVFLEVRESNHAAVSFYKALGFRRRGRRPGYYRDPEEAALVLVRSLDRDALPEK